MRRKDKLRSQAFQREKRAERCLCLGVVRAGSWSRLADVSGPLPLLLRGERLLCTDRNMYLGAAAIFPKSGGVMVDAAGVKSGD